MTTRRVHRAVLALATLARTGGWQCCRCGGWQPGDLPPTPQHCNNCR
ncbi:hypothetical protein GCM10009757_28120 [Streptomyces cheonanensis]|uniref:Uncharacterized protein n=1 Tax=Streptomyces cheonanensis TaxID=312720 RepID=A0ABP5GQ37_9ACTN